MHIYGIYSFKFPVRMSEGFPPSYGNLHTLSWDLAGFQLAPLHPHTLIYQVPLKKKEPFMPVCYKLSNSTTSPIQLSDVHSHIYSHSLSFRVYKSHSIFSQYFLFIVTRTWHLIYIHMAEGESQIDDETRIYKHSSHLTFTRRKLYFSFTRRQIR